MSFEAPLFHLQHDGATSTSFDPSIFDEEFESKVSISIFDEGFNDEEFNASVSDPKLVGSGFCDEDGLVGLDEDGVVGLELKGQPDPQGGVAIEPRKYLYKKSL